VSAGDWVWIERFGRGVPIAAEAGAPTVAVKDLIDVAGSITTAGCQALADRQQPALQDAECITRVRGAGGALVGKVNLHELAFGVTAHNPWFGTPCNPADPGREVGGSSSGSAVAVALGDADVAIGSDTGGSVRIPAACCGVVGLKTTFGRIPLDGVWPLAPSFDTVGPLARTVADVELAMGLIEGCPLSPVEPDLRVGRADLGPDVEIDPVIGAAVDDALRISELAVDRVSVGGWRTAHFHQQVLLGVEAISSDGWLVEETGGVGISEPTMARLLRSRVTADLHETARAEGQAWAAQFRALVARVGVLALPTLAIRPPLPSEPVGAFNVLTAPINLAGLPAISIPVPAAGRPPTGLQLVAPPGGEEILLALAARVEAAVAR
jgi:amidase